MRRGVRRSGCRARRAALRTDPGPAAERAHGGGLQDLQKPGPANSRSEMLKTESTTELGSVPTDEAATPTATPTPAPVDKRWWLNAEAKPDDTSWDARTKRMLDQMDDDVEGSAGLRWETSVDGHQAAVRSDLERTATAVEPAGDDDVFRREGESIDEYAARLSAAAEPVASEADCLAQLDAIPSVPDFPAVAVSDSLVEKLARRGVHISAASSVPDRPAAAVVPDVAFGDLMARLERLRVPEPTAEPMAEADTAVVAVDKQADGLFGALPQRLSEPLIFLSAAQAPVCSRYAELADLPLPCWAPQRLVAAALGHSDAGMRAAVASLGGTNYVWATELENVHSLWSYEEPAIVVGGEKYPCSEAFYHSRKPHPFSDDVWDQQKEGVMETAVRAKLAADPSLVELLRATESHPLLSLKGDTVWGFCPVEQGGENLLARIWMRVRAELAE
jgi:predicted NAD-dependent protein-ADP-ribosyltransferase YbiA (DUF1768 family)